MATIELRLSNKVQKETGRSEVMLRFFYTKHDFYAKTEVFINPNFFEYYLDRKKTINPKKPIPDNKYTATLEKAIKNGWSVRKSGTIVTSTRQIRTDDVAFHEKQAKRLENMKIAIMTAYEGSDKESLTSEWLKELVDRYNHPEKYEAKEKAKTFAELAEEYYTIPHGGRLTVLSNDQQRAYKVLIRAIQRYEGFVRETDKARRNYTFNIQTVTKEDIQSIAEYLKNENTLAKQYPAIYARLFANYPTVVGKGRAVLSGRGENTIKNMLERLKSLFRYFYEQGYTTNRPFDGYKIGAEKYGVPVYISIDERNKIADAELEEVWETMSKEERDKVRMPLKTLMAQRDIFVFQCLVGCRVGDLCKLTENHIHEGILTYTPHKTKNEGEDAMQARVPLHHKAVSLIEKYRGVDRKGRLFPCISAHMYNNALKVIFKMAGITRNVEVRNALTGENELVPINTIASSHLARRTFIGNAYFKVQDPNIIGKMSGHVEGSEAFKRYRKIEDSTLKDVIDLIG